MKSLLPQIKIVLLGVLVVCVCAFVFLIGWRLFSFITAPKSPEQLERDADHYYAEHYNKIRPDDNIPDYDGLKFGLIKLDGRYFLMPIKYWSAYGFHFIWPKKIELLYGSLVTSDEVIGGKRRKATIEVFMNSQKSLAYRDYPALMLDHQTCNISAKIPLIFKWNGIIVAFRFDPSHLADWPKICQETLHILDQVKELKHEQS